jgi:predicted small lipoprotein YifL
MSRSLLAAPARPCAAGVARVLVVLMVAALLAGCGKKGNPTPPPGEPNTYPRTYPSS